VPELIILPIYSTLPSEVQSCVFEPTPPGARKVVIVTNVAETSLTIPGIYYVISPGFAKRNAYDPWLGMDSLVVMPISQAQAHQHSGRAGRMGPGNCYWLYTESAYRNEMLPNSILDIRHTNLAHTILMLKAMGINDLLSFDFMDLPPAHILTVLEAYAPSSLGDEGLLTCLGHKNCCMVTVVSTSRWLAFFRVLTLRYPPCTAMPPSYPHTSIPTGSRCVSPYFSTSPQSNLRLSPTTKPLMCRHRRSIRRPQ